MATKEGKRWWDPYETSNRRQFMYLPNSVSEIHLRPKSTPFIDSYSQSGPLGSSVYNKDFSWKTTCKPECIRTGTASGQRRNNPHPSQSFMMWRLPRDAAQSTEYVDFPWKRPPSEAEISKALTAQYRSTYRCDFMPQGYDHSNNADRRPAVNHSRLKVQSSVDTEMRQSYQKPKQKPELMAGHYSCSANPNVLCRGIVPTVVQRQIHTQRKRLDLTSYDRFCGKRDTSVARVIKSLLPEELQHLHRISPEEEKQVVKTVLSKDVCPDNGERENKLPVLVLNSCTPEWISSWPGPL